MFGVAFGDFQAPIKSTFTLLPVLKVPNKPTEMKYILVTGGVISGVGKGVISSSFGAILKCCGIEVTMIKIDPYINLDAGTFSPYEHGNFILLELFSFRTNSGP